MKARDRAAVAALRSALGAIANAEAVDPAQAPRPDVGHPEIAGTVVGVGAAEVERRTLTDAEAEAIVRAEVAGRRSAASEYERAGQQARADLLRAEARALSACLDGTGSPAG
jgi:uncharacterized protein YqeY